MVLHGGEHEQSHVKGIEQYSQSLFDNIWSEHMLRVEKLHEFCPLLYRGTAHKQSFYTVHGGYLNEQ